MSLRLFSAEGGLLEGWAPLLVSTALAELIIMPVMQCELTLATCWRGGCSLGMAKPRGNRGTASLVKYTHEKDTGSSICPWGALVTLSGGAGWGWQRNGGGNTLESSALISEWRSLNSILGVWCLVTCHIVVTHHHQLGFIQWLHGRPSIFYLERKQGGYDLTR